MTDQRKEEKIFGLPVEAFGRRGEDAEEDDPSLRARLRALFTPALGWPLTILLWLIMAVNLYDLVSTYLSGNYGIFFLGAELPPLWSFLLTHLSAILRIIGVVGLVRTKTWGLTFYLVATFLFLLFCTIPEFNVAIFMLQIALAVALLLLLRPKWGLFD